MRKIRIRRSQKTDIDRAVDARLAEHVDTQLQEAWFKVAELQELLKIERADRMEAEERLERWRRLPKRKQNVEYPYTKKMPPSTLEDIPPASVIIQNQVRETMQEVADEIAREENPIEEDIALTEEDMALTEERSAYRENSPPRRTRRGRGRTYT